MLKMYSYSVMFITPASIRMENMRNTRYTYTSTIPYSLYENKLESDMNYIYRVAGQSLLHGVCEVLEESLHAFI